MAQSLPSGSNVLLIGATGMLGHAWHRLLLDRGYTVTAPSRRECDLCRPKLIRAIVTEGHSLVINCAAHSDVDVTENHAGLADRINGKAVGVLAQRCAQLGTLLVHYSSDYVFNGQANAPYAANHPCDPVNAYGRSKLNGEHLLQSSSCQFLMVRTSWLYAPWGKNFVRTIASLVRKCLPIRVVDDQLGRPTSAEHLARRTLRLVEQGAIGTWHVTDGGVCTWYEFACRIAQHIDQDCRVEACTSDQFPRPARRPAYSVLDISQTEVAIGPMPDWQDTLTDVLNRLEP